MWQYLQVLSLRPAKATDAESVTEIRNAVAVDLTSRLGQGYWSKTIKVRKMRDKLSQWTADLSKPSYFVAESEGEPVGLVALSRRAPNFWRKSIWKEPLAEAVCVFDLNVAPGAQRLGVGTFIMQSIEEQAKDLGIRWIRLDCFEENPVSQAFYRKLGYEDRGRIIVGGVPLLMFEHEGG